MKRISLILLAFGVVSFSLNVDVWAQAKPPNDEVPMMDVLIARPMGVAAGIAGTALFIVTLPFTVPTKSVDKSAKMFITDPFHFSFCRKFPDENLDFK